ncbi:MAG: hypothetical protein KA205_10165 [Acidobacteria bacterium]|nr:hypothetical protein [Acidobacteriota bacterium]
MPSAAQPDLLAPMRAAMGGDATLTSIQTLSIEGSESSSGAGGQSIQVRMALPDKFIRVAVQYVDSPLGQETLTNTHGFNGTELVGRVEGPRGLELPAYPNLTGSTGAERVARLKREFDEQRRRMMSWTLLLLAGANPNPGFTVTGTSDTTIDGKAVRVLALARWDGAAMQLAVDGATNLPWRLSWKGETPQRYTFTSDSQVTTRGGTVISASKPGEPQLSGTSPGSVGEVEYSLTVDQYKTDRGLTWPRRLIQTVGGKRSSEVKVSKYVLNPKFGSDAFSAR